jgi:hypothetical protein
VIALPSLEFRATAKSVRADFSAVPGAAEAPCKVDNAKPERKTDDKNDELNEWNRMEQNGTE